MASSIGVWFFHLAFLLWMGNLAGAETLSVNGKAPAGGVVKAQRQSNLPPLQWESVWQWYDQTASRIHGNTTVVIARMTSRKQQLPKTWRRRPLRQSREPH